MRKHVRNHASEGMKILEVGCGPRSSAETIREVELTCLDPSAEMLKICQKRVDAARTQFNEKPASYVQAIAEDIPLESNTLIESFVFFI